MKGLSVEFSRLAVDVTMKDATISGILDEVRDKETLSVLNLFTVDDEVALFVQ